jgi:hypothetical protein
MSACCRHFTAYMSRYTLSHTLAAKSVHFLSLVPPRDSFSQLAVFIIDDHSTVLPSIKHLPNLASVAHQVFTTKLSH